MSKGSSSSYPCFPKDAQRRADKLGRHAPCGLSRAKECTCQGVEPVSQGLFLGFRRIFALETQVLGLTRPRKGHAGGTQMASAGGPYWPNQPNRLDGSTLTPGPIVEEMATLLMKCPLAPGGLAFCTASANALMFSTSLWASNDDLPTPAWITPAFSTRNSTEPPFAPLTAEVTSMVTVPTFGFGIRPRGPNTLPRRPTNGIRSGVAMQRSKSIWPALTFSTRSSAPTTSAPAALASSALAPRANTATRCDRPDPFGRLTTPRTIWSEWRGSTPKFIAISIVSSNLALARSFTSFTASSIG